jgi:hypothetical protein
MSSYRSLHERRQSVTDFDLTDHIRDVLSTKSNKRCLDSRIINEACQYGERKDNPGGKSDTAIHYTKCGITFLVAVDTRQGAVVTAYPIKIDRVEAIKSCRWSGDQLRAVQVRIDRGDTKVV